VRTPLLGVAGAVMMDGGDGRDAVVSVVVWVVGAVVVAVVGATVVVVVVVATAGFLLGMAGR
jgi:hypothetical protein